MQKLAGSHQGYAYLLKLTVFINLKPSTTYFRHFSYLLKDFIWFEANKMSNRQDLPLPFACFKAKKLYFWLAGLMRAKLLKDYVICVWFASAGCWLV
jgi:hypothetical protein